MTLEIVGAGVDRTRPIGTPFQILECHPHGFVETVRVPSLDDGLQHLAYVETVFRQLDGILSSIVLSWSGYRGEFTGGQNGGTNPNQSEGSANGSKDLFCGGGFDGVPVQNFDSVVQERHLGLACARCHFRWLDLGYASGMAAVELKRCKELGARRFIRGLHALIYRRSGR